MSIEIYVRELGIQKLIFNCLQLHHKTLLQLIPQIVDIHAEYSVCKSQTLSLIVLTKSKYYPIHTCLHICNFCKTWLCKATCN